MLSDREKLILHFVAMIPDIVELEYMEKDQAKTKKKMMYDVIHSRCRSIAPEDVEEMLAGKILYEQLAGDLKWSMTGERPNKNTNWRDMR